MHQSQPNPMQNAASPSSSQAKSVKAMVANGHSIDIPTGQKKCVGFDLADGSPVYAIVSRTALPGEVVELPEEEVNSLRAAGFLAEDTDAVDGINPIAAL